MKHQSYIEELQNLTNPLEIQHIIWWLMKYEKEFYKALPITNCKKWYKWFYKEEKPFPCCCPVKEQDCLFIELYYDLERMTQETNPNLIRLNKRVNRNHQIF